MVSQYKINIWKLNILSTNEFPGFIQKIGFQEKSYMTHIFDITSIFTGYKSLPLQLILVIFCHMDYSENLTQQYNYKP